MEADGFTQMIDASDAFFAELAQNNNKEWFEPRKAHYVDAIKKPAELFADILADEFSRLSVWKFKPKVFRIYRDVRFSKDKTPYKAHLHVLWSSGEDPLTPALFFASTPGSIEMGMGVMGLKGEALTRYRRFVDLHGDALEHEIKAAGFSWSNWGEAPLKRVPKPYGEDHPHRTLLKKKNLIVHMPIAQDWRKTGLINAARDTAKTSLSLQTLLREI